MLDWNRACSRASLTRDAHARGQTVYVDPGVSSFDVRRFQALHLAHQPLLEVESASLARLQRASKRGFDILVASVIALLALPLMAAAALAIRIEGRGPVLFQQIRVGRHDKTFQILKFRTMVVDAEARLADSGIDERAPRPAVQDGSGSAGHADRPVASGNEPGRASAVVQRHRRHDESRRAAAGTARRGGRFPRSSSRPATTSVPASPDCGRSRPATIRRSRRTVRLDLFYVENWSLTLDMVIVLATAADHFLLRPLFRFWDRSTSADDVVAADLRAA